MPWKPLLAPYGLLEIGAGGGGADIGPLAQSGTVLFGFKPDSQRYFDYHHTTVDKFETVSQRELELGAASMAALVYLLDAYGLSERFKILIDKFLCFIERARQGRVSFYDFSRSINDCTREVITRNRSTASIS